MTAYHRRIGLFSLALVLLTAAVLLRGPRVQAAIAHQEPSGDAVPTSASVRITFQDQVKRPETERSFKIVPATPGQFVWERETLVFTPDRPLAPTAAYTVTISPVSARAVGQAATSWTFHTRAPRLLFIGGAPGAPDGIWIVEHGSAQRVIDERGITSFAIAPDGNRIVYTAQRDADHSAMRIYSIADGSSKTVFDTPDQRAANPAWSPTNDFITYERQVRAKGTWSAPTIWLTQTDGTPLGPLALGSTGTQPRFSPDARWLAFLDNQDLTVVSLNGAGRTLAHGVQTAPAWSPDNSAVAVAITTATHGSALQRIDATTGATTALGESEQAVHAVAWSPDGQQIAVATDTKIMLLDVASHRQRELGACAANGDDLAWSPDNRQLVRSCPAASGQATLNVFTIANGTPLSTAGTGFAPHWAN